MSCSFMDTMIYCCYVLWQMLCHMFFGMLYALADVIVMLLADVIAIIMCSRCCNHQADGAACCLARWQMLLPYYCVWQMLCQLSIHVAIIIWQMLLPRWQME